MIRTPRKTTQIRILQLIFTLFAVYGLKKLVFSDRSLHSRNIHLSIVTDINKLDYALDPSDDCFKEIGDTQVILNRTKYEYIFNPEHQICRFQNDLEDTEEKPVFLLALVMVAPNNYKERLQIRSTWANREWFRNVKTVFVVGKSLDEALNRQLVQENEVYRDLVQIDFIDSYLNLTLKAMGGIKWAVTYCSQAKYILKIDDDVVVNTKYYLNYLYRHVQQTRTIVCNRNFFALVARNPKKKNYVSYSVYSSMFYPVYCDGSAYTLTMDIAKELYAISKYSKYMHMEDVFVTGILAHRLRARYVDLRVRYSRRDDFFFTDFLKYPYRKYFVYANSLDDFKNKWHSFLPY